MNELYYFGCISHAGHCLFTQDEHGNVVSCRYPPHDVIERFGRNGERLDGMFTPPKPWPSQMWMESNVGPWRIVSWHDFSVDSRGGSHSTFVGRGYKNSEELLADANVRFREVFKRQPELKKG